MQNLKLPLRLGLAMQRQDLDRVPLADSIAQNLRLILGTRFGERRFDPAFGCEIFALDFQLIANESMWKQKLVASIESALTQYEPRLFDVKVQADVKQVELNDAVRASFQVRRRLDLIVNGLLTETRESFQFIQKMYLSPIALIYK